MVGGDFIFVRLSDPPKESVMHNETLWEHSGPSSGNPGQPSTQGNIGQNRTKSWIGVISIVYHGGGRMRQYARLDRVGDSIAVWRYRDWACNRGMHRVKGI